MGQDLDKDQGSGWKSLVQVFGLEEEEVEGLGFEDF